MMKKILVVDDNKNTTDLVQAILESAGYGCTRAHSGRECLELVSNNSYDLIILDIAMPDITGIDVVGKIKEQGLLDKNKIVFFTASSLTDNEINNLRKLGALDCLKKPFAKADLLHMVSKYV